MLFDYVAPGHQAGSQPRSTATVWSQFPLQPLAPGALTPFSYSVLSELASRAWYVHYDRLGFEPMPRPKVVRHYKGRVYFNISLSAQLEADHAAIEPLALRVNGNALPLATWEKPGFLAGFKMGRAQKKIEDTLAEYAQQLDAITDKARAWYLKTQGFKRWGQAEVLQIMEEIERVGVDSMAAFLAARLNLGQHYTRLAAETSSLPQASLQINRALGSVAGLVESDMLAALPAIADTLRQPDAVAWLQAGRFAEWRNTLPASATSGTALARIEEFIEAYGHRTAHEGEISLPRWKEDVSLLMAALLAHVQAAPGALTPAPANANPQTLLAQLPTAGRKNAEQSLQKIAELHKLQSRALHALAYIWAGTRTWALASAREAMVDKRLHSQEEVFAFELEEIKQMMTGEWNISSMDEIRALLTKRQSDYAAIQSESAPDLLVGDIEASVSHRGVPVVAGQASGPLALWQRDDATPPVVRGGVLASNLLDSGCVLALPLAAGFVTATGASYDPFVAAAHAWQRPIVVGLGAHYDTLLHQAATENPTENPIGDPTSGATITVRAGEETSGADVVTVSQATSTPTNRVQG